MSIRLRMALASGGLSLPETGVISVLRPGPDADLSSLPSDRVEVVHPVKPDHDRFQDMGYACVPHSDARASMVLVCLPRAKALAQAMVAEACARTDGFVVVDGSKTDGIDSFLKACRARVPVSEPVSKAHGKLFWFPSHAAAFSDWRPPVEQKADGFVTAPGVFSADAPDPASVALVDALPRLSGHVVDLGAGWGFLAGSVLDHPAIETLDLVEADATALDCARRNVTDPRARFHWADATGWHPEQRVDFVVMNPPFHTGRAADPSLGRRFIQSAAHMLAPSGQLWMVANRHLPYEATLADTFASVQEVNGNGRFKILQAQRPIRGKTPTTVQRARHARR